MNKKDRTELRGYRRFNRAMKREGSPIRMDWTTEWKWEIEQWAEKTIGERREELEKIHEKAFENLLLFGKCEYKIEL